MWLGVAPLVKAQLDERYEGLRAGRGENNEMWFVEVLRVVLHLESHHGHHDVVVWVTMLFLRECQMLLHFQHYTVKGLTTRGLLLVPATSSLARWRSC